MNKKQPLSEEEKQELLKKRQEERLNWINQTFTSNDVFEGPDDIPELPIVDKETWENLIVPGLIRRGAIAKDKLEIGKTYIGNCRNSSRATWNGVEFEYERYKWGSYYTDTINHFQDDNGHDLFVPIKLDS